MCQTTLKALFSWTVILVFISVAAFSIATWIVAGESTARGRSLADRACAPHDADPCQTVTSGASA
ncbi:hypothetical protein [Roseovarius indicus]|uniref:hypothetical protein n=1 Tax=Roseovarius indicus TaxID=540747 RepID=UPI0032EDF373